MVLVLLSARSRERFSHLDRIGRQGGTASDTFAWTAENVPNRPPVVADHAFDASGLEGDRSRRTAPSRTPMATRLTITGSGAGTVTDHSDGTWSWRYPSADTGSDLVDRDRIGRQGGTASDTFTWSGPERRADDRLADACSATTVVAGAEVTWTTVATDPGPNDTFTWWFDGGAGVSGGLTTTYTRSYDACGTLHARREDRRRGRRIRSHATSEATVTVVEAAAPVSGRSGRRHGRPEGPGRAGEGAGWMRQRGLERSPADASSWSPAAARTRPSPPPPPTSGVMRWNEDRYSVQPAGPEAARWHLSSRKVTCSPSVWSRSAPRVADSTSSSRSRK